MDDHSPVVFDSVYRGISVARIAYLQEAAQIRNAVGEVSEQYWSHGYSGIDGFDRLWVHNLDQDNIGPENLNVVRGLLGAMTMLPEFAGRNHAVINRYRPGVSGRFLRNGLRPLSVIILGLTNEGQIDYFPEGAPHNAQPESVNVDLGDVVDMQDGTLLYRGADKTTEVRYSAVFYCR
jgi:hypothetical protein